MNMKPIAVAMTAWFSLSVCASLTAGEMPVTAKDVVAGYADIGYAAYSDSLTTAQALQNAVDAFLANPSADTQTAAKAAWLAAREPYGQTEVFRFGNANVDDWEGKVNAWPLDEGLIDYVVSDYEYEDGNDYGDYNLIAKQDGPINAALLESFQEKGGSEANVATGYHAVEFLLWGQDLNAKPADSGLRTYTDFIGGAGCTHGHCDRRRAYLKVATDLLVTDLEEMVADWAPGKDNYRAALVKGDANEALKKMLFGMGSLSLGELAGDRINVALLTHSQEDEHSCFSDNTHRDIWADAQGIANVYLGTYTRIDGSVVSVPSLSNLMAAKNQALDLSMKEAIGNTMDSADVLDASVKAGEHFDQQIQYGNKAGKQRIRAIISALKVQTADIIKVGENLGIKNLKPASSDSFGG